MDQKKFSEHIFQFLKKSFPEFVSSITYSNDISFDCKLKSPSGQSYQRSLILLFGLFLFACNSGSKIKKEKIAALVEIGQKTNSEAILVYKENKLVLEKYFGLGSADKKIETMSCTKSIVGLALACLISDGKLSGLDVPVCNFYSEFKSGDKNKITLRHLCNMTSGLQDNQTTEEIYKSDDFIKFALDAKLIESPGQFWRYNNKAVNLLAGVIFKLTNKRMDLYIAERLFKPLDISDYSWSLDNVGNPQVMAGCMLRPLDFAKLGLVVLNKGKFNNEEIFKESAFNIIMTPADKFKGYASLWFLNHEKVISIIDDSVIMNLRKANLPATFINKVILLKGVYSSDTEYFAKVEKVFGKNSWQKLYEILAPKQLRLSRKEYGGNITYVANGFLGNYLIISPSRKIVAVRMTSHESHKTTSDDFAEFEKLALDLEH